MPEGQSTHLPPPAAQQLPPTSATTSRAATTVEPSTTPFGGHSRRITRTASGFSSMFSRRSSTWSPPATARQRSNAVQVKISAYNLEWGVLKPLLEEMKPGVNFKYCGVQLDWHIIEMPPPGLSETEKNALVPKNEPMARRPSIEA